MPHHRVAFVSHRAIFALLMIFAYKPVHSQCCSPGNPSSGNQLLGSAGPGALRVLLQHQFAYSDTYYRGDAEADQSIFESADFHYLGLSLDYGLPARINAYLDLGYYPVRERTHANPELSESVSGFSNGTVGARYLLMPFRSMGVGLQGGTGLKFPLTFDPIHRGGFPLNSLHYNGIKFGHA